MRKIKIALAGNPNTGKTTIFNEITGAHQKIANYPGVTVEKKHGTKIYKNCEIDIIDLPGTYSLNATSLEEKIARRYIIEQDLYAVVNVIDASNLERNLYLTIQLIELNQPVIIALNMTDEIEKKGIKVDTKKLSKILGCPVVKTVGNKGKGITELLDAVIDFTTHSCPVKKIHIKYGNEIEEELDKIERILKHQKIENLPDKVSNRWIALKLLENDEEIYSLLKRTQAKDELKKQIENSKKHLIDIFEEEVEMIIAERRYGYISGLIKHIIYLKAQKKTDFSHKIDTVLTNRILGIPIFLGIMYLIFYLTFTIGEYPMIWIENFFMHLSKLITLYWPGHSESILKSLIVDGVIGGVGGVIVFLPNIMILFFGIAILEDTGYLARAAFLMDKIMKSFGLHGKSFIPMLIGFGCTVPAIMATRTLENPKDRFTTIMVLPLMSCGARLPIYALIIPAFFPHKIHAAMLFLIYIIGISLAVLLAKLLKSTLFKSDIFPFILELPPYRIPTLKSLVIHMWDRGYMYLKKAGTIILGVSIVLWFLTNFPKPDKKYIEEYKKNNIEILQGQNISPQNIEKEITLTYSVAGRVGKAIEPIIKHMGFDWKIGTALIGAFAAKEVFVSQMGIVYAAGEADEESESLRSQLKSNYNPLIGFCIMIFMLIATPCMATLAITAKETGSFKWALFQTGLLTSIAFVLTSVIYYTGNILFY